jgi:hypothetical protein
LETKDFKVSYTTHRQFAEVKSLDLANIDFYEGQVELVVDSHQINDVVTMKSVVQRICSLVGMTRRVVAMTGEAPFMFRVEFDSVDAANRAVNILNVSPDWELNAGNSDVSSSLLSCLISLLTDPV